VNRQKYLLQTKPQAKKLAVLFCLKKKGNRYELIQQIHPGTSINFNGKKAG